MIGTEKYRVELAAPGVEVRTHRDDWSGCYVTEIAGGKLDGETFRANTFLGALHQHKVALGMARVAAGVKSD